MTWYPATVTVAAASEPITLADAKRSCRIDASDTTFDDELNDAIASARGFMESTTGTRLVEQTIEMRCDSFADLARLPVAPLSAIVSVEYVDTAGSTQTLAGSVYEARLFGLMPSIALAYDQSWPAIQSGSLITVTATAGYDEIPAELLDALRLAVAQRFASREMNEPGFKDAFFMLIANHRVWV